MLGLMLFLLQLVPSCPTEGFRTSPYGRRHDPITHRWKYHKGLDIGAPEGTAIRSMWPGTVVQVRSMRRGYGNYVIVRSGRFTVLFAHLDEILVDEGASVKHGSLVGLVGQSGRATGPHLHVEVRRDRRRVDPDKFLQHCPDGLPIKSPE